MNVNPVASYYSATAHIGREPAQLRKSASQPASYYSATADIGAVNRKSLRDIYVESALVNGTGGVGGQNGALGYYRSQQAIADSGAAGPASTLEFRLSVDGRALDNQSNFFTRLQKSLLALSSKILDIQPAEAFNASEATSSDENVAQAVSATFAKEGEYEITVEQLAVSHQISSDEVTTILSDNSKTAYDSLNLSGTFTINGYTVTVETSDSLADIRDTINLGEDEDGNGILTTESEDLNGNGKLDVYYQPSVYIGDGRYLAAFSYSEDRDKDGVIDTSEDSNDNDEIDGGSAQIKAKATIEDNRLVIKSLEDGAAELRLDDDSDILETLGFYKRDDLEIKYLKTSVDSDYNKEEQSAAFTVDGKSYVSSSNFITEAIPDVALELIGETDDAIKITVLKNPDSAVGKIVQFASAYNDVVRQINYETIKDVAIRDNRDFQRFAEDFVSQTQKDTESISDRPKSLKELGLILALSAPDKFSQTIKQALENSESDEGAYRDDIEPTGGVMGRLSRMGILGLDDFTLSVDREKLGKELSRDAERVYEVFNKDPDGVASRLINKLSKAVGEPFGLIASQQNLINFYKSNPGAAAKIIEERVSVTEKSLTGSFALSTIDTIVA